MAWLFVNATYYLLLVAVLCWAGTYLHVLGDQPREKAWRWVKENWRGLVVALAVTVVAGLAVEPALRVLSDEANLVGTSKNLFASKTATFTVSGKNYYGSYWDIDAAIDRRPALFPFLVSLVHVARGYSYRNVFHFNLLVLFAFVLVSYRLAKSLGGERFGVVAALFVVAHPITLISARSGGFDLFSALFGLLVVKSALDVLHDDAPGKLSILWLNVCLFAEVRYETALFVPLVVLYLLALRRLTWSALRPYLFVYALTPAFLLPRVLQAVLRGSVPEQEPGTVTFSADNFFNNAREYFASALSPLADHDPHAGLLLALGVAGCVSGGKWAFDRWVKKELGTPPARFAAFVTAWVSLQAVIVFTYFWGRAQYPSAARLLIPLDTFFSFAAAWAVSRVLGRTRPFVACSLGAALLAMAVPVASQHRLLNRLTQTRESAATWAFFERLEDKSVLVVTDRPSHFTIMNLGAMSFEAAKRDPYLFTAFARHLFHEVYVIQQIELSTGAPLPGYESWPDRPLETALEFQNDANVLVRVSRLVR